MFTKRTNQIPSNHQIIHHQKYLQIFLNSPKLVFNEILNKNFIRNFYSNLEVLVDTNLENIASVSHLIKPMKEKLDIDELIEEQHYQGADRVFIDGLVDEMGLRELLKMV